MRAFPEAPDQESVIGRVAEAGDQAVAQVVGGERVIAIGHDVILGDDLLGDDSGEAVGHAQQIFRGGQETAVKMRLVAEAVHPHAVALELFQQFERLVLLRAGAEELVFIDHHRQFRESPRLAENLHPECGQRRTFLAVELGSLPRDRVVDDVPLGHPVAGEGDPLAHACEQVGLEFSRISEAFARPAVHGLLHQVVTADGNVLRLEPGEAFLQLGASLSVVREGVRLQIIFENDAAEGLPGDVPVTLAVRTFLGEHAAGDAGAEAKLVAGQLDGDRRVGQRLAVHAGELARQIGLPQLRDPGQRDRAPGSIGLAARVGLPLARQLREIDGRAVVQHADVGDFHGLGFLAEKHDELRAACRRIHPCQKRLIHRFPFRAEFRALGHADHRV